MNPGGIFLSLAGVWVLCQIFGGHALQRLRVLDGSTGDGSSKGGGAGFIAKNAAIAKGLTQAAEQGAKNTAHLGAVGDPLAGF